MKAVIMAGGKGTRLRPLTLNTPKPMVPLLNRPCMSYIIDLLKRYDIHQIAVTVQYLPDVIRQYYGDGSEYGVQLIYAEEDTPLGTAGSIKNAAHFLDEPFIVISGDALTDFNLRHAIEYHRQKQALATMVLTQVDTPLEYGVVMTGEDGRVARFLEKPSWSEVFSDTVNTGIYVLEPEILNWIPAGKPYDFSMDLFPELLANHEALYGYVASGYWSDIGNLQQYRQTQFDMLDRKVGVTVAASEVLPGLFVEAGVRLPSRIRLSGPAYIGSGCTLYPSCGIGPYTVLGESNTVHSNSILERTIAWSGNYIGEDCDIQDALIMDRTIIGSNAQLQEGTVIGSGCTIGSKATIRQHVKMWPNKTVPTNGTLHTSLIWGDAAAKPLFSSKGVAGIPNVDVNPEFMSKLAAAYGSTLPESCTIMVSACSHTYSSLLKTAFTTGLRSVGVHIVDLGIVSDEVTRNTVRQEKADGAVHLYLAQQSPMMNVVVEWMDRLGLPIAKSAERKIENAYWQEDFVRCHADRVGSCKSYKHADNDYLDALAQHIDFSLIRDANFTYVLLVAPCADMELIQRWSTYVGGTRMVVQQVKDQSTNLHEHVHNCKANFGVYWDDEGKLSFVTPKGSILSPDKVALLTMLALAETGTNAVLGVPASMVGSLPASVASSGLRVIRTKESLRSVMEATVGLPFSPFAHRLYMLSLILQHLAITNMPLDDMAADLPNSYTAKEEVSCNWNEKGTLMRCLMDWVRSNGQAAELLDGIRIQSPEGCVLILPDQDEPLFKVYAHADSPTQAKILAHNYASRIVQSHQQLRK
ncbi:NTP transferase domain-containing protein [Paenibacillus sp. ACRRX]|uniref:sugar phosphate nucleotidyltransferase n=1 Tax=unclassified Paenibacillus TaxID=185978 RepID=UPI001EF4322B|nr:MULTISPECIES: sugar phosphate nucleotidyltransferase [unclassified Paenibacillus]MCG7409889.1 NTP transferase domain-containing protein [Paenibacillus sp. ACRRX]MDK8183045.1 sugar phosphate nucleotidyltransferase [Paenibacillus sp. UMB4589-SE434]